MNIFFLFVLFYIFFENIYISFNYNKNFCNYFNTFNKLQNNYQNEKSKLNNPTKCYMKRLRNASVEIDLQNRKNLTKTEIIKMFMKSIKECKNVEILKERLKGHIPRSVKRKLMKQRRMIRLRMHIKNQYKKAAEYIPPGKNILNFPKNQLKNINAAVLYFRHYFQKFETNHDNE